MMKRLMLFFVTFFLFFPTSFSYLSAGMEENELPETFQMNYGSMVSWFYNELNDIALKPDFNVFSKALTGFLNLKANNQINNNLLTIIDFSLPSNQERMWIVDVHQMKVLHTSLVSHGRNSGELYANRFSNVVSSYQSSLGFYLTGDIYSGKHGMSLLLEGQERGINDKARERAIVIHSADYVSEEYIKANGRLGRSHGCPAIPVANHQKIIKMIAGGSCLYIYHPEASYHQSTEMLTNDKALAGMKQLISEGPEFLGVFSALPFIVKPA